MKIYRAGRTANRWKETTEVSLKEWAREWQPDKKLTVDATIDKFGNRHSDIGIEFDKDDLLALSEAFLAYLPVEFIERTISQRSADRNQAKIKVLKEALGKISALISKHREDAPSEKALLNAIKNYADHYRINASHEERPKITWIKWEEI